MFELKENEIQKLLIWQDFCDGTEIDGQPIDCFDVIVRIVNGQINSDFIADEQLSTLDRKLRILQEFWGELPWFDKADLDIVDKLAKQIEQELERRIKGIPS